MMKRCSTLVLPLLLFFSAVEANCCCHPRDQWLPQTELWQPLLADPRQIMYSAAYRTGSSIIGQTLAAVSFGDDFFIYRWYDRIQRGSQLQLSLEGGIYGLFNLNTFSHDLVNTDYYVALPLVYKWKCWIFRLRLYHISSHLGDEFLLDHPDIVRYNPAFEALDFYASFQWTKDLRVYAGIGDYLISDTSFRQWPIYVIYGFEYKPLWIADHCRDLAWKPYLAVFLQNREMDGWSTNQNYAIGMEVSRLSYCGEGYKARLAIEWYNGFDPDGQLQLYRTHYGQLKLSYWY